jgi:hypothetical protein
MDHPLPWLRYLDASDVDDETTDFEGMRAENLNGEKLGTTEGFVVDSNSGRPYYVVIDAGGWFKSKHFLLPVGHARLDPEREALVTPLSKERVKRFPGFELNEFQKMTDEEWRKLNDQICEACGVTVITYAIEEPLTSAWDRADYSYPDWWHASPTLPDRMGDSAYKNPVDYPEGSDVPVHRSKPGR